jgi:LAO/AO transport system kinase
MWEHVRDHHDRLTARGEIAARRRRQEIKWMWAMFNERLHQRIHRDPATRERIKALERAVGAGEMSATHAAEQITQILAL